MYFHEVYILCLLFVYPVVKDSSELKQFLNNTHEDWNAGRTSTYLATVKEIPVRSGDNSRYIREASTSDLLVDIGDGGTWKGYPNGALKANRGYRYGQGHIFQKGMYIYIITRSIGILVIINSLCNIYIYLYLKNKSKTFSFSPCTEADGKVNDSKIAFGFIADLLSCYLPSWLCRPAVLWIPSPHWSQ